MAIENTGDLLLEEQPSKRARLENLVETSLETMDDVYSTGTNTPASGVSNHTSVDVNKVDIEKPPILSTGIPGLGLLGPAQSGGHEIDNKDTVKPSNTPERTRNALDGPPRVDEDGSSHVTTALEAYLSEQTQPALEAQAPIEDFIAFPPGPPMVKEAEDDVKLLDQILNGNRGGSNATTHLISSGGRIVSEDIQQSLLNEITDNAMEDVGPHDVEFEVDLSPIESSSDESSSDDSSSSEDSDAEDAYKLLGPEEQARILMEGDGGSDDEGGKDTKGLAGQLRTKNEVPDEVIPKPDVTITATMKIEELGAVEGIVENILLIKAKISGEYKVLESGSVLCLADRSVIGVVSETLGRVQQPLYSVRFTNADEIKAAGCDTGTMIYYSEQHSTYVFTQALKVYKGSDASNLHDEEVGDEEVEFSDDEAEAAHRKRLKQKKNERRGGRMQANGGSGRGGHPLQQQQRAYDPVVGISYDDDDGPYQPLARPAGFADTLGRSEAPIESEGYGGRGPREGREHHSSPPPSRGRGRGGRGDRGRGRGERGRGRGGFQERRHDDHMRPSYDHGSNYNQVPQVSPPLPHQPFNYNHVPHVPYSTQQPHFSPTYQPTPSYLPPQHGGQHPYSFPAPFALPPPPPPQQHVWPNVGSGGATASGAYLNPAFFGHPHPGSGQPQAWPPSAAGQNAESARAFEQAQDIIRSLTGGRG